MEDIRDFFNSVIRGKFSRLNCECTKVFKSILGLSSSSVRSTVSRATSLLVSFFFSDVFDVYRQEKVGLNRVVNLLNRVFNLS